MKCIPREKSSLVCPQGSVALDVGVQRRTNTTVLVYMLQSYTYFFFPIVVFSTFILAITDVTVFRYSASGRNINFFSLLLSLSIIIVIIININIIMIIISPSLYSLSVCI